MYPQGTLNWGSLVEAMAVSVAEPTVIPFVSPPLTVATLVFELLQLDELVASYVVPVFNVYEKLSCLLPPTVTAKGLSAMLAPTHPLHVVQ